MKTAHLIAVILSTSRCSQSIVIEEHMKTALVIAVIL